VLGTHVGHWRLGICAGRSEQVKSWRLHGSAYWIGKVGNYIRYFDVERMGQDGMVVVIGMFDRSLTGPGGKRRVYHVGHF
jgi:hypothetical protein